MVNAKTNTPPTDPMIVCTSLMYDILACLIYDGGLARHAYFLLVSLCINTYVKP